MLSLPGRSLLRAALLAALLASEGAHAVATVVFSAEQSMEKTAATNSDTIRTEGYLFTYTLDKLFTGGIGMTEPIGRTEQVQWPDGLHAQAITTPFPGAHAQVDIRRVDANPFDLHSLTFRLLANTFGTGADLEITPIRGGEDGPQVFLDASGSAGMTFSYSPTASDWRGHNTSSLVGYDRYKLGLFVDFALTDTTLIDASAPAPEPRPICSCSPGSSPSRCCGTRRGAASCTRHGDSGPAGERNSREASAPRYGAVLQKDRSNGSRNGGANAHCPTSG